MNIYEITGKFLGLQNLLEAGEIDEDTFDDTLECLDMELEEKADNYAKIIKNLTKDTEGLKVEEKRLKEKRQAIENNVYRLKKNLEIAMTKTKKTKFKTDLFSFGIQKNKPSLEISDEAKIPKKYYVKQEPKLDKITLFEAINNGSKVKGVTIKQTESLRIR